MTSVCVLLAPGFEEIEAVAVIDVLRRARIDVVAASVDGALTVTGSHGITIAADAPLAAVAGRDFDVVVLPGGMPGSAALRDDARVQDLVRRQHAARRRIAAICAAPIALARAGVLAGRAVTSYPSVADQLGDVDYREEPVVVDERLITSRAPGTALRFALRIVAELVDDASAARLGEAMLVDGAPSVSSGGT